ncbi:hypothetical protein EIP91_010631 [Steccherinum ochraceum]|uniref:NADP-dependent oxidoreductase domain-containing protein n=1 Tax=Steccherinum ochraceum TaxID=92696 RepID=A0A4R0R0D7_9APHY|nr:hypothetical protein EIP91_010631 [Steccherinum ochraceum]
MAFPPAPDPQSKLQRYRRLAPSAGVYVSPLQLGGMSIGNSWAMGSGGKEDAFKLMDAFFDAGGNFIDTANGYHGGQSEEWIGEWVEKRKIREQVVIATKFTDSPYRFGGGPTPTINNAALLGNSAKSLTSSLDISLRRLQMSYVDILYVHWWDYSTSVEEMMNALHNVVVQGKVLFLGASNMPAWVVADANRYAKCMGKTPFVIYQGAWNILSRDFERDTIPMARAHGMALAPWNIFQQGKIRTDAEEEERKKNGQGGRLGWGSSWERTEDQKKLCRALEKVAAETGARSIRAVAIAYLMHKTTHVFPLLGVRNIDQLNENVSALDVHLAPEHMTYLESILPFEPGAPHDHLGDGTRPVGSTRAAIVIDWDQVPQPIRLP